MKVLKDESMEVHYIGSYQMHPERSFCLGLSAKGLMVWQIHEYSCLALCKTRIPYGSTSIAWTGPYCMDGSLLAFLNCTNGSVLTHLIISYGSILSHLRFSTQFGRTRIPQSGISLVPWLLCKKSNKKRVWNRMRHPIKNTRTSIIFLSSVRLSLPQDGKFQNICTISVF